MLKSTEWTKELRYKPYDKWDTTYREQLAKKINKSDWNLHYHVQPVTGLLNDPNGFSFFNEKWHLFYQAYPMGPVHGLKSWYHLTSDNLVDWVNEGFSLLPDSKFDSHGVYSGSALAVDDRLLLVYTGNVRDEKWNRKSYQMGAYMNKNNEVIKEKKPLISFPPSDYTQEFRDPQVFRYEDDFFMIIGGQNENLSGKVLAYVSKDTENWRYLGELKFSDTDLGYMIECPNLIFIDNRPVLLFCPQGLSKDICFYENIYPNCYIVGNTFEKDSLTITDPSSLKNLDDGFDVYASQAFNAPDGRALMVSWIGLPEVEYPSFEEDWAHCLSITKELTLVGNQLLQTPVAEQAELRTRHLKVQSEIGRIHPIIENNLKNSYELKLDIEKGSKGKIHLFADEQNQRSLVIAFDTVAGSVIVDRENSGIKFAEHYGFTRTVRLPEKEKISLQIFVDHSVCEIFINQGTNVLTTRVFPEKNQTFLYIEGEQGNMHGDFWELRPMKIYL